MYLPGARAASCRQGGRQGLLTALVTAVALLPAVAAWPSVAQAARPLAPITDARVAESSGLAASRVNDGLFWTHNDSGGAAELYAFDRQGRVVATLQLLGASAVDWEDMAAGPGPAGPSLYVGDIGDNARQRRDLALFRVPDPRVPRDSPGSRLSAPAERFAFEYPDGPRDAETLLVHPTTGEVLIVTKEESGQSSVYRFPMPLRPGRTVVLERAGTVRFTNPLVLRGLRLGRLATGGDVSPDGSRVFIRTYAEGYEWRIPEGATVADALRGTPRVIALPFLGQFEAVCYRLDGQAVLTTSEGSPCLVWEVDVAKAPAPRETRGLGPSPATGRPTERRPL
ncbi:MAG TPA: hypothetical protein VLH79_15875 [Chthonomonadales bacterium]|nr:hypothetical protein [Chthonomonadales bacterium]